MIEALRFKAVEWRTSCDLVAYGEAAAFMDAHVREIREGAAPELVWLLEHPPCYTAGTSAKPFHLTDPAFLPVYTSGRGGALTYHGPGQRIAYLMIDVAGRFDDVRAFVRAIEAWIVAALAELGVAAFARDGRPGVWVLGRRGREEKIAALGLRVRRGISLHGISLNVAPDLSLYRGILPCGIADYGVTSLSALGVDVAMPAVDAALERAFEETIGPVMPAGDPLPTLHRSRAAARCVP